jgi:predicted Zn-dependent protease
MTQQQLLTLGRRVIQMTRLPSVQVRVTHTARIITRMADNRVLSSDDGDILSIGLMVEQYPTVVNFYTNQLNDTALLAGVQQSEALLRSMPWMQPETWERHETRIPDPVMTVSLWHDSTIRAMTTTRETVVPDLLQTVSSARLRAAGFLGFMARADAFVQKADGIFACGEETDSEVTVTARDSEGTRTGWDGRAARDWATIDYQSVAKQSILMATLCGTPVAVEPGRRTAILAPAASIHVLRWLGREFHARDTDAGRTALSKFPEPKGGNKLRERIWDTRFTMNSDPNDPDGGYFPYFENGHGTPPMTWIKDGVLTNLAYDVGYGLERGKQYAKNPSSFRLSARPIVRHKTLQEMIASCKDGIYVNRLSDTKLIDVFTGMTTGVTRDGCFLIKDGKIIKAVKNFRILESPFLFMNRVEAVGVSERASFGYAPPAHREPEGEWPRPPIIIPPLMVSDFNFSALADAV